MGSWGSAGAMTLACRASEQASEQASERESERAREREGSVVHMRSSKETVTPHAILPTQAKLRLLQAA